MTYFASPGFVSRALAAHIALASVSVSLAGCAGETADAIDDADQAAEEEAGSRDAGTTRPRDAGTPTKSAKDAATPGKPSAPRDAGRTTPLDSGAQAPLDASSNPVGDALGSVDWEGIFSADGGLFTPPGPASPDNPKECPAVAPDNPIGSCIGVPVYATCKYGSYTCLCDWVHWLCI